MMREPMIKNPHLYSMLQRSHVIAGVGSRKYTNKVMTLQVLRREYFEHVREFGRDLFIGISGGCPGPDIWFKEWCKSQRIMFIEVLPADSSRNNYFIRNEMVAQIADELIAFIPRNQLRSGTWNTIRHFRELGNTKNYTVFDEQGEQWDREWSDVE